MNILADLLELLFIPGAGPETPRGWLVVSLIYGTVVSGVLGYTLLYPPSKADTTVILAVIGAPLGLIFSALHFVREPYDRLLSLSTFVANALAMILVFALWP